MPLDVAETTRSTTLRCSPTTSTSTATVWPTVDMTSVAWECLFAPTSGREDHEAEDHEPEDFATVAAEWLNDYMAVSLVLRRVVSAAAAAKSQLLLRDLVSDEGPFLLKVGTAPATWRRKPPETGMQAVAWPYYLEETAAAESPPPNRYPLLQAALDAGQLEGGGLPTPGRRTLRIVEENDVAPVDEQVGFGTLGIPSEDRVRRRRLR